jgi:hypothetical protein
MASSATRSTVVLPLRVSFIPHQTPQIEKGFYKANYFLIFIEGTLRQEKSVSFNFNSSSFQQITHSFFFLRL